MIKIIKGIDVSKWQGNINWEKVASAGNIKFAFIKATEGKSYVDSKFKYNAVEANSVGIKTGFYHFLRVDNSDSIVEANHFFNTIKDLPVNWLVCDIEDTKGNNNEDVIMYVMKWLIEIERLSKKMPIIYTYLNFANTVLKDSFINYPLWLAHYEVSKPGNTSWQEWICWQYTNKGQVEGISGNVDLNYMKEEFFMAEEIKGIYKDVTDNHWAKVAIEKANELGLMTGYSDNTFKPDQPVTRAELASVIVRLYEQLNK